MNEKSAFVRAICEDPACNTVRLVYADWLEEHGEEVLGQFIRYQMRGATDVPVEWIREVVAPVAEVFGIPLELSKLPRENSPNPFRFFGTHSGYCPTDHTHPVDWRFRRGFLHSVRCSQASFLAHARDLFRAQPVTEVVLSDVEPMRDHTERLVWWERQGGGDGSMTRHELHPDIFYADYQRCGFTFETFGSESEARGWQSDQCVRYGRAAADLPPLNAASVTAATSVPATG